MWLNEKEGPIIGPFKKTIEEHESSKWLFVLDDDSILEVGLDGEYESDNGLDEDEEGYEEYFALLFVVLAVIRDNSNLHKVDELIEINYHNIPKEYKLAK